MSRTLFTRTSTRTSTRALAVGAALLMTSAAAGVAVASGHDVTRPDRQLGTRDAAHPGPAAGAAVAGATATGATAGKGAAKAVPREAAALTGSAKLFRKTTEDVTFTFDAHLAAKDVKRPDRATGTFEFAHLDRPGGAGGWAKGRIDCLVTGGKVATATGVITETDLKGVKGGRVGFSVHDLGKGKQDRVGYSWGATGGPDGTRKLPKCNSNAPFEKVRKGTGDFAVLPWHPVYPTD